MTQTVSSFGDNLDELSQLAFRHCIFPLADMDDVRAHGPNIYVKGEGIKLTDQRGRTYLDMMSSHTRANSLGYANREIADAIHQQLVRVHYVGTVDNFVEPTVRLAARLASLTPGRLDHVMYVSGGSEAVESALKLAKQYHIHRRLKPRAHKIISRWNAYHGAGHHGGTFGHRLVGHASYFRTRRSRRKLRSGPDPLSQPVEYDR